MKVAVAQISCSLGDVGKNLDKIDDYAGRARSAGAHLAVFPEMADTGYNLEVIGRLLTQPSFDSLGRLSEIASKRGIAIAAGIGRVEASLFYNTLALAGPDGTIVARYDKAHLYRFHSLDERECFNKGASLVAAPLEEFKLGLAVCYDIRFPELFRTLAVKEATNVFLLAAAWPSSRLEHLRCLAKARSIENQSYMVLANRVGKDSSTAFCGSSMIIDPFGNILASGSEDQEELIFADLSLDTINTTRERMRVFEDRREDIY